MRTTAASQTTRTAPARGAVVVYDGQCPFCRRQIERMRRRDVHGAFEYLPRQAEGVVERFPMLAEGDFNSGMRLVHPDGSVSVGADAIYEIARRLKGWKHVAWLYRVPPLGALARRVYAWVAKHRLKLGGDCDRGCRIG